MKVSEVMSSDPGYCRLDDNLTRAAEIMWERDCGVVPVVDAEGRVVGVVTDRDIAIAAASRGLPPAAIRASEMHFAPLKTCAPGDDVKDALRRMRKYRIRRLCVTTDAGELVGMLSLADALVKAGDKKSVRKLIFSTLDRIARPAPIVLRESAGEAAARDDEEDGADESED